MNELSYYAIHVTKDWFDEVNDPHAHVIHAARAEARAARRALRAQRRASIVRILRGRPAPARSAAARAA